MPILKTSVIAGLAILLVTGAAAEDYVHGRIIDTIGASWLLPSG